MSGQNIPQPVPILPTSLFNKPAPLLALRLALRLALHRLGKALRRIVDAGGVEHCLSARIIATGHISSGGGNAVLSSRALDVEQSA